MERRKNYSDRMDAYMGGVYSQATALENIEAALKEERNTPATDQSDARQRDKNLETLTTLRDKVKHNVDAQNARITADAKKAADDKAELEAKKKAKIMADLRQGFAGSDDDWERLKEQLYDNYLINTPSDFDIAVAKAKASGAYKI